MRVSAYTLYFQKLESLAYIFIAACMGLCSFKFVQWASKRIFSAPHCVLAVQGRSGSSKVDDFGTNRKRVYDFLLVRHCHHGPILHRFRDMVTYWLKIAYFCYIFPTPLSFGAFVPYMFPSEFRTKVNRQESWGYPPVKTA